MAAPLGGPGSGEKAPGPLGEEKVKDPTESSKSSSASSSKPSSCCGRAWKIVGAVAIVGGVLLAAVATIAFVLLFSPAASAAFAGAGMGALTTFVAANTSLVLGLATGFAVGGVLMTGLFGPLAIWYGTSRDKQLRAERKKIAEEQKAQQKLVDDIKKQLGENKAEISASKELLIRINEANFKAVAEYLREITAKLIRELTQNKLLLEQEDADTKATIANPTIAVRADRIKTLENYRQSLAVMA